jgi:hypothetical protein
MEVVINRDERGKYHLSYQVDSETRYLTRDSQGLLRRVSFPLAIELLAIGDGDPISFYSQGVTLRLEGTKFPIGHKHAFESVKISLEQTVGSLVDLARQVQAVQESARAVEIEAERAVAGLPLGRG